MSDMIEKLGRVAALTMVRCELGSGTPHIGTDDDVELTPTEIETGGYIARAVLTTLLEPDEEMVEAGYCAGPASSRQVRAIFTAMINTAIGEGK